MSKSKVDDQFKQVLIAIKVIIKERKISYAQLGKDIQMSESGVKKLFGSKDCTIGKIITICNYLNISLNDVFKYSDSLSRDEIVINKQVQNFFIKNLNFYKVFWIIVCDNLSPDEIIKYYGIEKNTLIKILKKLDSLKLITYRSFDDISYPNVNDITFSKDGSFLKYRNKLLSKELCKRMMYSKEENDSCIYNILNTKLRSSNYNEFDIEISKVLEKYKQKSIEESNIYKEDELINSSFFYSLREDKKSRKIEPYDGTKLLDKYE